LVNSDLVNSDLVNSDLVNSDLVNSDLVNSDLVKSNIVVLIPARSGSKGIINKNIKLYKGIPLLAHSIKISLESKYINEVYVSSDSEEYNNIAIQYGAKITPIRSKEISDDLSPDIDTFTHFINMYKNLGLEIPNIIIHLRPTYPNRTLELLNNTIEHFLNNYNKYDSLRTVVLIKKTPYKMYYIDDKNILIPFIKEHDSFKEPFNQARQNFPETYLHNGCIDIIKSNNIINNNLLSGKNILPYIMNENEIDDIDDIYDFTISENKILI
jgi:N-acylneuraminate cytidylyltransferase